MICEKYFWSCCDRIYSKEDCDDLEKWPRLRYFTDEMCYKPKNGNIYKNSPRCRQNLLYAFFWVLAGLVGRNQNHMQYLELWESVFLLPGHGKKHTNHDLLNGRNLFFRLHLCMGQFISIPSLSLGTLLSPNDPYMKNRKIVGPSLAGFWKINNVKLNTQIRKTLLAFRLSWFYFFCKFIL